MEIPVYILIVENLVVAAGFFVFGNLFGRRNSQKLEQAVAAANDVIASIEAKVKAIEAKITGK